MDPKEAAPQDPDALELEGGAGATHVKGAISTPYCCGQNPMCCGGPKEKVNMFCPNTCKTLFCAYDKVMWSPLADGSKCQVLEGCQNPAFNTCQESYPLGGGCYCIDSPFCRFITVIKPFEGCGKKMCIDCSYLMEIWDPSSGPWCICKPVMVGFCCNNCKAALNKAFCCNCGPKVKFTGVACNIF